MIWSVQPHAPDRALRSTAVEFGKEHTRSRTDRGRTQAVGERDATRRRCPSSDLPRLWQCEQARGRRHCRAEARRPRAPGLGTAGGWRPTRADEHSGATVPVQALPGGDDSRARGASDSAPVFGGCHRLRARAVRDRETLTACGAVDGEPAPARWADVGVAMAHAVALVQGDPPGAGVPLSRNRPLGDVLRPSEACAGPVGTVQDEGCRRRSRSDWR